MKKIVCFLFSLALLLPLLSSCTAGNLSLGLGVIVTPSSSKAEISVTVAAVTLKGNGRIVDCEIDTLSTSASGANGELAIPSAYKTKGELGDAYNMLLYGNARAEWYEQRDAFCDFARGKTIEQIKTAINTAGNATDPGLAASCTINVDEFLKALVRACKDAKETNAKKGDELVLSFYTQDGGSTLGADGGKYAIVCNVGAFTINEDKITAARIDTADVSVALKKDGTPTSTQQTQLTKRQKGDDYGMLSAWGSKLAEWHVQVDAFEIYVCGKTEAQILGVEGTDGKTTDDALKAFCTIAISDFCRLVDRAFE